MPKTRRRSFVDAIAGTVITAATLLLIMPSLASLTERRDAEGCLANLRRIGSAARMYESDFEGRLVPYAVNSNYYSARYTKLLYPYLRNAHVFSCPADHLDETAPNLAPYPSTYGVNWYVSSMSGVLSGTIYPGRHRSFVKDPAHTIWAADSAVILSSTKDLPAEQWQEDLKRAPTADIYYFYLPQDPNTGQSYNDFYQPGWSGAIVRPFPRHAGRVNVCFYDGHAGSVPASQFDPKATQWGKPGCLWDNVPG